MPSPMDALSSCHPHATVPGVITDLRALKGGKENRVFAYLVKVESMGGTYELQTRDEKLFNSLGIGQQIVGRCGFESFNGQLRLALKFVEDVSVLFAKQPVVPAVRAG